MVSATTKTSSHAIPAELGISSDQSRAGNLKNRLKAGPLRRLFLSLRSTKDEWSLAKEFFYDFRRVCRFSSAVKYGDNQDKLEGLIVMAYHSLEKGLSLRNPRPGFGQGHVLTLLTRVERYMTHCALTDQCQVAINVLDAYTEFNRQHGVVLPWLDDRLAALKLKNARTPNSVVNGGVKPTTRAQFLGAAKRNLDDFFESRSSVRQYSNEPVAVEDIQHAVRLAQKTPSVCNRQSGRAWLINTPRDVQDALTIQGGTRGFGEEIGTVLVVTSDLACFQSAGERYQCWIDGGLFAMSLIYALHSLGLATCCLNWSKGRKTDLAFKTRFGIPHAESIILLISVGHPIDTFNVAQSWRRPVAEVLRTVSPASSTQSAVSTKRA